MRWGAGPTPGRLWALRRRGPRGELHAVNSTGEPPGGTEPRRHLDSGLLKRTAQKPAGPPGFCTERPGRLPRGAARTPHTCLSLFWPSPGILSRNRTNRIDTDTDGARRKCTTAVGPGVTGPGGRPRREERREGLLRMAPPPAGHGWALWEPKTRSPFRRCEGPDPHTRSSNWVRPAPRRRFPPTASFTRRAGAHAWVRRAETRRFQEGRAGTHCAGAVRRLLCPTPLPAPGAAPPSASNAPSLILRRGARGGQPAQRASGLPTSRPPADNVFSFLFMLGFFLFIFICFFSPFFL